MARLAYAIVFVRDMARSVAFYRDVLGLTLRFDSPHWTEFACGETSLALHLAAEPNPDASPPQAWAGHCHLGFSVPDLDAFHQQLVGAGVVCHRAPQMEDFGSKLAHYADPDGLPITISEERLA